MDTKDRLYLEVGEMAQQFKVLPALPPTGPEFSCQYPGVVTHTTTVTPVPEDTAPLLACGYLNKVI